MFFWFDQRKDIPSPASEQIRPSILLSILLWAHPLRGRHPTGSAVASVLRTASLRSAPFGRLARGGTPFTRYRAYVVGAGAAVVAVWGW